MRLRHSGASPFVRKVLVFAHETGLRERIDIVPTDVWAADNEIFLDTPLGKVPVMVTVDGTFNGSILCCEYLDSLHAGPRLIPNEPARRWPVLQRHALADGILEAAVAHVIEQTRRPAAFVYPGMLDRQRDRIRRTLDVIEADCGACRAVDLAAVTLGCALGFLDFRHGAVQWRVGRPKLTDWYTAFAQRPSMQATWPSG
jgi:glutathione S-transferase